MFKPVNIKCSAVTAYSHLLSVEHHLSFVATPECGVEVGLCEVAALSNAP